MEAFAQDLVQCMALYLAETIASLFYGALQDSSQGLVDSSNAPLLSPTFWVQAIYTELLHAGCRYRAIREKEARRPATSLVKVTCVPFEGLAAHRHKGKRKVGTSRVNLLGDRCWAGNLLVWFPAAWMPLVAEAIHSKNKNVAAHQGTAVLSASAEYLPSIGFKLKRWHADRTGLTPILHGSTNVSWLTLDPAKIVSPLP